MSIRDSGIDMSETPTSHVIVHLKDVDTAALLDTTRPVDSAAAARLRKKIDCHLMPLMCLTYLVTFADKTTLGQAAVLGIIPDIHLTQSEFNSLGAIFYIAYMVFEYPQNLALQRFRVGKWLSANVFIWAIALLSHTVCKSFGTLFVVRFLLGVCEGAITPGFMIMTSMFYTRSEQNKHVGYWFSMNGFAAIFLGFVSFGVLHAKIKQLMAWQLLMIITGAITLLTSILMWFFFPDSPTTAYFLTEGERVMAVNRIKGNQTGVENKYWKREQFIETLLDRKVWVMAAFAAVGNIVNSLTNQRQIIINQFGFTPVQTTLLGSVDGAVEILSIWLGVCLASHGAIGRGYAAALMFIPAFLGSILVQILPLHDKVGLLLSYWISIFVFTPFVILLGWSTCIISGHTKRTTTNAIVLSAYAIGNAVGPFMWKKENEPRNHIPWSVISACIGICLILILTLRFMLKSENKHRDGEKRDSSFDSA